MCVGAKPAAITSAGWVTVEVEAAFEVGATRTADGGANAVNTVGRGDAPTAPTDGGEAGVSAAAKKTKGATGRGAGEIGGEYAEVVNGDAPRDASVKELGGGGQGQRGRLRWRGGRRREKARGGEIS